MEKKFCYLKGIVECSTGRVQDCNNKRTTACPLEQEHQTKDKNKNQQPAFCFLKGLVECSAGRVQDCNIKRVEICPKD